MGGASPRCASSSRPLSSDGGWNGFYFVRSEIIDSFGLARIHGLGLQASESALVRQEKPGPIIEFGDEQAGPSLDRRIEEHVARLLRRNAAPWRNPPPYSASVERARFLQDILERGHTPVEVVQKGATWTCTVSTERGTAIGRGETEALAICAAFIARHSERSRHHGSGGLSATPIWHRLRKRVVSWPPYRWLRDQISKLLFP